MQPLDFPNRFPPARPGDDWPDPGYTNGIPAETSRSAGAPTLSVQRSCPAESRFARAAQSARRGRRAPQRTATINVASKGLNGGEIAGIVIGSVVGAVLIGGLIYSAVTGGSVLAGGKVGGYYRMGDNGIEM